MLSRQRSSVLLRVIRQRQVIQHVTHFGQSQSIKHNINLEEGQMTLIFDGSCNIFDGRALVVIRKIKDLPRTEAKFLNHKNLDDLS